MMDNHYHFHTLNEREIVQAVRHAISPLMEKVMAVSQEVQGLLDQAKQNNTLVKSVDTGLKALQAQARDLEQQIADLKANAPLSADDKAALVEASTDMAESITTLQSDIPANTPEAGGAPTV